MKKSMIETEFSGFGPIREKGIWSGPQAATNSK